MNKHLNVYQKDIQNICLKLETLAETVEWRNDDRKVETWCDAIRNTHVDPDLAIDNRRYFNLGVEVAQTMGIIWQSSRCATKEMVKLTLMMFALKLRDEGRKMTDKYMRSANVRREVTNAG